MAERSLACCRWRIRENRGINENARRQWKPPVSMPRNCGKIALIFPALLINFAPKNSFTVVLEPVISALPAIRG